MSYDNTKYFIRHKAQGFYKVGLDIYRIITNFLFTEYYSPAMQVEKKMRVC